MSEGKRVALIVACDRYSDPELKQLKAPSQDAEAFARILENPKVGGFKVTALINQPHWTVTEKIDHFLQSCNRGDTVLLYFSCHGIKDKNGQLYFATVTTDRRLLLSTGIESNFVNNVLDHCRALQKVVLLDCCYSGAFEKGRIVRAANQVNATEFFGRGKVVITASDSIQYALEEDRIENLGKGGSYFTNALIKGLESGEADVDNDGKITYSELYEYVSDYVKNITPNQTPTLNTFGVEGDFVIFKNIRDSGTSDAKSPVTEDPILEFVQKASTLLEEGNYDNAIKIFDTVLMLRSGHIEALNGKGVALCNQEKFEEALACFDEVLKLRPRHPYASTYVRIIKDRISKEHNAKSKHSNKDLKDDTEMLQKQTEKKVRKALTASTKIPLELIREGNQFYEKGMYQDAILCYNQALKIEPKSELAWNNKGNALDAKGDYKEALFCFKEALKINPISQIYRDNVRIELEKLGGLDDSNYPKHVRGADPRNPYNDPTLPGYKPELSDKNDKSSETVYKSAKDYHAENPAGAVVTNPNDPGAWHSKGLTYSGLSRYEEAIECYDKAIEIDPNDANGWNLKGYALRFLGRYEEAIECYDKAIEIDPNYTLAWIEKGLGLAGLGRYEEAIKSIDRGLELNPHNYDGWYNKGLALLSLGKVEEAIKYYDKAIELEPDYAEGWFYKGAALHILRRYEEAIKSIDRGLEINPNHAEGWFYKGAALAELRRYEEAIKSIDKALEINPDDAEGWYGKSIILELLGNFGDAKECRKKARELGYIA